MITVLLPIDLRRNCLVAGLNDPTPLPDAQSTGAPALSWKQGDTVQLVLQGLLPNDDDAALQRYLPAPIPYASILCTLTVGADAPPVRGTVRLRVAEDPGPVTPRIPLGTPDAVAATLNVLSSVASRGGLTVEAGNASNIYLVRWIDPTVTATIACAENSLYPRCFWRAPAVDLPDGRLQILKFAQYGVAATDRFTLPNPPACTVQSIQLGTGTQNCVQRLLVPRGAIGQVALRFAANLSRILAVESLTAAALADALNGIYTDGLIRFSVEAAANGRSYLITCVGPLEKADQPLITVEMHDQAPIETPTAELDLDSADLELLIAGKPYVDLVFELQLTDGRGKNGTPIQTRVRIVNDAIDEGMALAADPDWLEDNGPEYPPYDPAEAAIVVPGAYIATVGGGADGETTDPTGRIHVYTHNQGTEDLLIELRETGGSRRRVPDDQYDVCTLNENQVRLTFPVDTFPALPLVGQYRLSIACVKPESRGLPHHTHPIADVLALQDILNGLLAGMNPLDLWPQIPDAKLPVLIEWRNPPPAGSPANTPGPLRFRPLLPELLPGVAATRDSRGPGNTPGYLRLDQVPPEVLRVNDDGSVTITIGTPPNQVVIPLFTVTGTPPTLQFGDVFLNSLTAQFTTNNTFLAALTQIIQSALGGGALLPPGLVYIAIADVSRAFPAPVTLEAHCAGDKDRAPSPVAGSVLPAVFNTAPAGDLSGGLPVPSAPAVQGKRYRVAGAANAAATNWRPRQDFRDNQTILSNGRHWYAVEVDGATAWPTEYDCELFGFYVSPEMFVAGSRFACEFVLQTSFQSPDGARGQYRFRLELGRPRSLTGPGIGGNLSDVDWYGTVTEQILQLSSATVYHRFGYAVNSPAGGLPRQAERTLYARSGLPAAVPQNDGFALRATLTRFDVDDGQRNPTGLISLRMAGARASVIAL